MTFLFLTLFNLTFFNKTPTCEMYNEQSCLVNENCGWCPDLSTCVLYDACHNSSRCPGPVDSIQTCEAGGKWLSIILLVLTLTIVLGIPLSAMCSIKKIVKITKYCYEWLKDCTGTLYWQICRRNELEEYTEIL